MRDGSKVQVLDHGSIQLVSCMGDDLSVVNAARTSFDQKSNEMDDRNKGLINYLMREKHGTPFEMVQFQFAIEAPIFVVREWQRHRIGSFNEMSGRYTELPRLFYVPARDQIREQKGKPGAYYYEMIADDDRALDARQSIAYYSHVAFDLYEDMIEDGVAKEVARMILPLNTYTKFVWSVNLRALLNFINLRAHPTAQYEIRVYAEELEKIVEAIVPDTMHSFRVNGRICP